MTGQFSGDLLLGNVVLYWRHCIRVIMFHYSVYQKFFNIKLTWVLRGMMDVFHVYCFKSVGVYKHKLSRIESLVILYWGINCISIIFLHICDFSSKSNGSIYYL